MILVLLIIYINTSLPIISLGDTVNTMNNEPSSNVYESITTAEGYYLYIETHYPHYTGTEAGWWNYMSVNVARIPTPGTEAGSRIPWWYIKVDHSLWDSWAFWWEGEEPFDEYTSIEPLNPEKCYPQPGWEWVGSSYNIPIIGETIYIPGFTYIIREYSLEERKVIWKIASYNPLEQISEGSQDIGTSLGVYIEPYGQYYESLIMYRIKMGKVITTPGGSLGEYAAQVYMIATMADALSGEFDESPELGDGLITSGGFNGYDNIIPVELGD